MTLTTIIWRYGMLTANILISTINVIFLSFGVSTWGSASDIAAAWTVATIGLMLFALSFIGCCISLRDSFKQSMVFAAASLTFLLVQIIYVITFAVMKDEIIERTAQRVQTAWAGELRKSGPMRNIEFQYDCCGMDGPQDYLKVHGASVPSSCCWAEDCSSDVNIFSRGCGSSVVAEIDEQSYYFIWSNIGLIVTYIFGAICAYFHGKRFENVEKKTDEIVVVTE